MRSKKEPWKVAALIAEMMRRSEKTRGRLSEVTLRNLAGRKRIEASIRSAISEDLLDYGYLMHRLEGRGPTSGSVLVAVSALHAAKPIKAADVFTAEERQQIVNGNFDFDDLHEALIGGGGEDEEEE